MTSAMLPITTSIVQGSAVGPASYVVSAANLTTVSSTNQLAKYADDTYLIIPASNVETRTADLDHIEQWAGYLTVSKAPRLSSSTLDDVVQ